MRYLKINGSHLLQFKLGGVDGYAELKEIQKNPKHAAFETSWEWVGLQFSPFKFNTKATEKVLAKLNATIQKYESGFNE